ncbi:MAG: hypothetical protein LBJ62_07000 [Bifidobacteriaceae bacterium]|jgi:hypothetical protein|nr:hypothetical protein [Bifidobacteriaceae bacterium]
MHKLRLTASAMCLTAATLAAAACATPQNNVPTLIGDGSAGLGLDPDVLRATQDMVTCLRDDSVPAAIGTSGLTLDTAEPFELCDAAGCYSENVAEETNDLFNAFREAHQDPESPIVEALFFGQADLTEAYLACKAETGYTASAIARERLESRLEVALAEAAASLEWAKCARANGYPTTMDPVAPTLANLDERAPVAVLPGDLSQAELRALLAVCPVFDQAAWAAQDAAIDAFIEAGGKIWEFDAAQLEEVIDPSVGFDVIGFDGTLPERGQEADPAEAARLWALMEIIYQDQREHDEARAARYRELGIG